MNSCYLSKLEQIRLNAKDIAQHNKRDVYIAKAENLVKYKVIFGEDELTPAYHIIEKVKYTEKGN